MSFSPVDAITTEGAPSFSRSLREGGGDSEPLAQLLHLNAMPLETNFVTPLLPPLHLRIPAEPMPPPIKEPPSPPENPDAPVREPDPDAPEEI